MLMCSSFWLDCLVFVLPTPRGPPPSCLLACLLACMRFRSLLAGARSVDKRVSQILNGHTGTFAKIKIPGRAEEAQVSQSSPSLESRNR